MCPQLNGFYSNMYLRWLELNVCTFTFGGRILHSIWPPGLERKQLKMLATVFLYGCGGESVLLVYRNQECFHKWQVNLECYQRYDSHTDCAFADYGYCYFYFFLVYAAKMNVIVLPSLPPVLLHAQNVRKLTTSLAHLGRWGFQILKLLSSGVDLQRCSGCSWICCPLLVRERHTALFNVFEWHVFLFFFSFFYCCAHEIHIWEPPGW